MASVRTSFGKPAPRIRKLLILGGGAAAFAAATRCADAGVQVVMVNDGLPLGGTCVNVGCMPTKFLLEALQAHHEARRGAAWRTSESHLDYARLVREMRTMVGEARGHNYHSVLAALGNVELVEARGRIAGPGRIDAGGKRFEGDAILVATGARTRLPDVPGIRKSEPLTHVTALDLDVVPESVAVIGGGPEGLEWAQILHRAGARVTVLGRVLPKEEPEIANRVHDLLRDEGIVFRRDARMTSIEKSPDALIVRDHLGGATAASRIFAATGLLPNTANVGLEEVGVATDAQGFVATDVRGETNVQGIYAAGDVTGGPGLETVAAKQGFLAAHNAITGERRSVTYDHVPHAVFTDPQVASVGWTEARMMRELGRCLCRTLSMEQVPKALAARDTRGLVKLVVHPDTHVILGAHAVGRDAGETIHLPTFAIQAGWTIDQLIETVHVFPTYAEAWKICAQTFLRSADAMSCCVV